MSENANRKFFIGKNLSVHINVGPVELYSVQWYGKNTTFIWFDKLWTGIDTFILLNCYEIWLKYQVSTPRATSIKPVHIKKLVFGQSLTAAPVFPYFSGTSSVSVLVHQYYSKVCLPMWTYRRLMLKVFQWQQFFGKHYHCNILKSYSK